MKFRCKTFPLVRILQNRVFFQNILILIRINQFRILRHISFLPAPFQFSLRFKAVCNHKDFTLFFVILWFNGQNFHIFSSQWDIFLFILRSDLIDEIIEIYILLFVSTEITDCFFLNFFIFFLNIIDRFFRLLLLILFDLKALERFILRIEFVRLFSFTLLLDLLEFFIFFDKLIKLNPQTLGLPAI